MKTWQSILLGVGIAAAVLIAFMAGRHWPQKPPTTPIEVKVDTFFIHDTFTQYKPKYITKTKLDSVPYPVTDTMRLHDTLFVLLEREQVMWEDSLARIYASGVNPKVDSVVHFSTTQVITETVVVEKKKRTHWGMGVQVGYGAALDGRKVVASPYVGVGVSYNIWSW